MRYAFGLLGLAHDVGLARLPAETARPPEPVVE